MYVSPILSIYCPVHQSSPSVQSTSPVHSPVHSLDTPLQLRGFSQSFSTMGVTHGGIYGFKCGGGNTASFSTVK